MPKITILCSRMGKYTLEYPRMIDFGEPKPAPAQICLVCRASFPDDGTVERCPTDGAMLTKIRPDRNIGTILADKYEVMRVIGEGAWGRVYKARHVELDIPVAVKVLHENLLDDPIKVKRFQQEAKSAGALHHPNLVTMIDHGLLPTYQPFMVMELVDGTGLDEVLRLEGPRTPDESSQIALQICAGLKAAHEHGIIHRDLKPSNVMLVRHKGLIIVKLLDFGLAKLLGGDKPAAPLTEKGEALGTPSYMSPEQCRGEPLDARSDVYALGCILYEMVTGTVAVGGSTSLECMHKHVAGTRTPIAQLRPELRNSQIEAIINKALKSDPNVRYQNCDQLAFDLQLLSTGGKGNYFAQMPTFWSTHGNKIVIAIIVIAVLTLIATALLLHWIPT